MPRPARIALAGLVYHIINRGNNRQDVFRDEADFLTYLKTIRKFKEKYSFRLYHSKYKSSGHLWQGRFKNPVIQADEYLLQCLKYIELNPVRANMVKRAEDYRWSSYNFHAFGKDADKLLDKDPAYLSLADTDQARQKAYQHLIASEQDEGIIEQIRKSIAADSILGSEGFIDSLRKELSLAKPKPRGRPKTR